MSLQYHPCHGLERHDSLHVFHGVSRGYHDIGSFCLDNGVKPVPKTTLHLESQVLSLQDRKVVKFEITAVKVDAVHTRIHEESILMSPLFISNHRNLMALISQIIDFVYQRPFDSMSTGKRPDNE